MTARGQNIGISIGILDKLMRTTLGLKRGALSRAGPGAIAPLATLKRRLWWDHRMKDYHNRDFVDKEWRNVSQTLHLYWVYTQIYVQLCITEFM
jgi:hypothetical protein